MARAAIVLVGPWTSRGRPRGVRPMSQPRSRLHDRGPDDPVPAATAVVGTDAPSGRSSRIVADLPALGRAGRASAWLVAGVPFLVAGLEVERGPSLALAVGFLYFLAPYALLRAGTGRPSRTDSGWIGIAATNVPALVAVAITAPPAGSVAVGLAVVAAIARAAVAAPLRWEPATRLLLDVAVAVLPFVAGFLVAGLEPTRLPWLVVLGAVAWTAATGCLSAIRGAEADRQAGRATVATRLGTVATADVSLAGYGLAVLAATAVGGLATLAALPLAAFLLPPLAIRLDPGPTQIERAWRSAIGTIGLVGTIVGVLLLIHWSVVSPTPSELVATLAVTAASLTLGQAVASIRLIRRSRRRAIERFATVEPRLPRLAVIVACRDDADRLPSLVAALGAQDHPDLEIIVVDDGSSDGSADVARAALARDRPATGRRDRVIGPGSARTLARWSVGARDRGARAASRKATHLLFLGADVTPAPDGLRILHGIAVASRAGLVSGVPAWPTPSLAEALLGPALPMAVFGFVPIWALTARGGRSRRLAVADGSLLLVDRAAYLRAGGVDGAGPREAVELARRIVDAGRRVRIVEVADRFARHDEPDRLRAWHRWRASALAAAGDSFAGLIALVAAMATAWLLPLIILPVGLAAGDPALMVGGASGIAIVLVFRTLLARLEHGSLTAIVLHPVTVAGVISAAVASLIDGLRGTGR